MTIFKKTAASVLIAAILVKRRKSRMRKVRIWSREWIQRRETEDITGKLINEMRKEDLNGFRQFIRLSVDRFDFLLEKVRPVISKKDTNMRKAISAETRLLITLRYLSTGDSYRSLMYLFRVAHNTMSGIISQTCKAIFHSLREEYLQVL